jgi:hypothetical protein
MPKPIKKKVQVLAQEAFISEPRLNAIIKEEVKKGKKFSLESLISTKEMNELYKKYFGKYPKNKL